MICFWSERSSQSLNNQRSLGVQIIRSGEHCMGASRWIRKAIELHASSPYGRPEGWSKSIGAPVRRSERLVNLLTAHCPALSLHVSHTCVMTCMIVIFMLLWACNICSGLSNPLVSLSFYKKQCWQKKKNL